MRIVSGTALAAGSGRQRRLAPCRSLIATPKVTGASALRLLNNRGLTPLLIGGVIDMAPGHG